MNRKLLVPAIAVTLFMVALFLGTLWQPTRQVRLHQRHLLRAIEDRNWQRAAKFMADDYSDRWGHDKEFALREAREVFRQFFAVTINQEERSLHVDSGNGMVFARLKLDGTGGPLAHMAIERINALTAPFVFRWQQRSWKPWDWQLIHADQPELELPEGAL
jgi:hypothetical protein